MNATIRRLLCAAAVLASFAPSTGRAVLVNYAWIAVGDPGNAPDTVVMNDGTSGYGAVSYNYGMGDFDVTNAQYAAFLSAKASVSDPYGLYNSSMTSDTTDGGIVRSGSGPYSYSPRTGFASKPVTYVSWYDAIRFANWLTNGQGNGNTESGTYLITGGGVNSGTVAIPSAAQRSLWAATDSAHWLLPSEDEWYKAAYYKGGGTNAGYWLYPFRSDVPPAAAAPSANPNAGDFNDAAFNSDGFASDLSNVGAYSSSLSPYGAFDMGGDVWQWNEGAVVAGVRGTRGASWNYLASFSESSDRAGLTPGSVSSNIGFRLAVVGVPEPDGLVLLLVGAGGVLAWRRRRHF